MKTNQALLNLKQRLSLPWARLLLFILLSTLMQQCLKKPQPVVIGHRGAMGHELENTIPSIQKALELKVDMIEIDVFKIASGELVVFHDETLQRLAGKADSIQRMTWTELKRIPLKGNHHIPLLKEVIEEIDRKVPLNIELKGKNTAEPVYRMIQEYRKKGWQTNDFLISSFHWKELSIMKALDPSIRIAVLVDGNPMDAMQFAMRNDAYAINPNYKNLTLVYVGLIKRSGFMLFPYTINDPEEMVRFTQMGVDGFFTDYPDRAR